MDLLTWISIGILTLVLLCVRRMSYSVVSMASSIELANAKDVRIREKLIVLMSAFSCLAYTALVACIMSLYIINIIRGWIM